MPIRQRNIVNMSLVCATMVTCLSASPATLPTTQPSAGEVCTVTGLSTAPLVLTVEQMRTRFASDVQLIQYDTHGKHHAAHAVPLLSVIEAVGVDAKLKMDPKVDPKTKNLALRMAVVVRGRDGYTATFALAELLPEIGDRPAWIALDADERPLQERSTPVELIAPGDAKPGRWVRGVASITVVDPTR